MITHLELDNFTVFDKFQIKFSPKINVIIGENGSGKTHLLKMAYALSGGPGLFKKQGDAGNQDLAQTLTTSLLRLFLPMDGKPGKLHRTGADESARIKAEFLLENGEQAGIHATIHNNSRSLAIHDHDYQKNYAGYDREPAFIPTKEMISFMKGFGSLYEKYALSFDQTYYDTFRLLELPELRRDALHQKTRWAMSEIETICGGRFLFHGGGNVTFKTHQAEYSANVIAEGFRKAGILGRLMETGAIQPGVGGTLFWDEPEANMNPKLMKLLVEILLELSRNGQQIVLATHDYVTLKWFDLLTNAQDHVRFHALRRLESGGVVCESCDGYLQLKESEITATFSELYDADVERALGGGGS